MQSKISSLGTLQEESKDLSVGFSRFWQDAADINVKVTINK